MKWMPLSRWIASCLVLFAALIPCRLVTSSSSAAENVREILEKAIKAHGGEAKLAKLKNMTSKAKGTIHIGFSVPFSQDTAWQCPDRLKITAKLNIPKPTAFVEAIAGDECWSVRDGKTVPLSAIKCDELRTQAYVRRLLLLVPLLQENAYKVSALEEIRIDNRPAAGVAVSCTGERDVKLYFDAETGRLAKTERRVQDEFGKKESVQEEFFTEYRDFDGVPTATKQVWLRDGKKAVEMTLTDVRYPDRLDATVFADPRPYTRKRDVIFGHKAGTALTMDVFVPNKNANGAALVVLTSAAWFSDSTTIDLPSFAFLAEEPVKRGYTVFSVSHGSQPHFTVPEAIADVKRAVRYIRYHARDWDIDPNRIGITGASSGGHLSLMLGVSGDSGDSHSTDPVERTSNRVQAVGCFFPPTDFLNYGAKDKIAFSDSAMLFEFRSAIDVREFDKRTKRLERLSDKDKIESLYRRVSPLSHVSDRTAPTLIIHGDADKLVPIQQAEVMVAKLKEVGVPAELIVKKGMGHGYAHMDKDMGKIVDWFDKYLKRNHN